MFKVWLVILHGTLIGHLKRPPYLINMDQHFGLYWQQPVIGKGLIRQDKIAELISKFQKLYISTLAVIW